MLTIDIFLREQPLETFYCYWFSIVYSIYFTL